MRLTLISIVVASCSFSTSATSQTPDIPLGSQQRRGVIDVSTVLQRYDGPVDLREFSVPIRVMVPATDQLLISASAGFGAVSGDAVTSMSGLTDLHVEAVYATEVGRSSVVFSLGAAVPIGRRDLTVEEFDTSLLLSQQAYRFRVPGFGEDFRLTPSLAFAIPIAENFVAGFGGSYLLRSSYSASEVLNESYSPGNELALTAGMDLKLGPTTFASADVTYTTYGTDALGTSNLATIGDKVVAVVQLRFLAGPDTFRLLGLYRSQSQTSSAADSFIAPDQRGAPSRGELQASYSWQIRRDVTLDALGRLRSVGSAGDLSQLSGEAISFPGQTVLDFGGGAVFSVDQSIDLPVHVIATVGGISGVEFAAGLRVRL